MLDDSQFYNALLTEQLHEYATALSLESGFNVEMQAFLDAHDFLDHLDPNTDVAFIDFYLGEGTTASDVLHKLKRVSPDCEVIIISKLRNLSSAIKPLAEGATQFIFKDNGALVQSCLVLKDLVNRRFNA